MNNYYEVALRRMQADGPTYQDQIISKKTREFARYLNQSPNTVRTLSIYETDNSTFAGVILTNKQDKTKQTKRLLITHETKVQCGTLIMWGDEVWLLYEKDRIVIDAHQSYYMIRCNRTLNWVDQDGIIKHSPAYVISSVDNKVKENFRTWNSLVTPQPNKYAEIWVPYRTDMPRYTKFIMNGEGWYIIDDDTISVPGIMYASLGETKVNDLEDDIPGELANIPKAGSYSLVAPSDPITVTLGKYAQLNIMLYRNGEAVGIDGHDMLRTVTGPLKVDNVGNVTGVNYGTGSVTTTLTDLDLSVTQTVVVQEVIQPSGFMIVGSDTIKLGQSAKYTLESNQGTLDFDAASIDSTLAKLTIAGNICTITANSSNKLGEVVLTITRGTTNYTRTIKIASIW